MTSIIGDKAAVIAAIQKQVQLSTAWMDDSSFTNRWLSTTSRLLERFFSDSSVAQKFVLVAREGTLAAVSYLEDLTADIQAGLFDSILPAQEIDEAHFHIIIGKILQHFNKHMEEMYHKPVHGKGTLQQENLNKITLGNEYDVQRVLFSLLRPLFPETRVEVAGDGGYKGYRSDLFFDTYDTVIEVKCSRPSMSERTLTEEIGSDAYHYTSKHVYFFIYDKERIISNVDAFCKNYSRPFETKQMKTIVIQPVQ